MHILIVSCVFPPEPVTSAIMSEQLAVGLVDFGHNVTVITSFPNRPAGRIYADYRRSPRKIEITKAGYRLIRTFSLISTKSTLIRRFLENLSFGITSSFYILFLKADVIYANTWPIFATGMLYAVAQIRRIPLIIHVKDIYPESIITQQRVNSSSLLARFMCWVDKLISRGCKEVIVISEHFASVYRDKRGVATERVHIVYDWVNEDNFIIDSHPEDYRLEKRIPNDAFLAVYGGNIGVAAGVETVIEAMNYLKYLETLYLIIAGQGSNLAACQNLAREGSCSRTLFHTPWPSDETAKVLSAADVLVLPTIGDQSLASMPSKLISYMFVARPVIALALPQSDLAQIIERSGCGWVITPDHPELLADTFKKVMSIKYTELVRRGQAGRKFAQKHFSRQTCLPQVIDILEQAVTSPIG